MLARCRFAPSPNGPLHLGHAYSVVCNERVAARLGAERLLRMEDIDLARCTPALEAAARVDLGWFGYAWTGPVRRQGEGFSRYAAALDALAQRRLLYPCFCTRGDVLRAIGGRPSWPHDPDGSPLYPGTCRALPHAARAAQIAAGEPYALRLDMAAALTASPAVLTWTEYGEAGEPLHVPADPARWGDAVLRRKDIPASYHVAVVVDDGEQEITDIVRGADLLAATGLHRLIQVLLGLPEPRYHHHRLVLDEAGQKLSKSRNAPSLASLRRQGVGPDAVRRRLAMQMGPPAGHGSSIVSQ